MIIFKCKMCGADIEVEEGSTVGECEYCFTRQTVPQVKDDDKRGLYNRANVLRLKSEFDKAEAVYERILEQDATQSEAYWGVLLCKYGIEYVSDPATGKRIPTCHRASYDAMTADEYYKLALQYAKGEQRELYGQEAKYIDSVQKEILSISQKEEPYDVFICYKESDNGARTRDSVIANEIYHQLTQEGYKVFYAAITLEEKLGREYEPIIFAALNSAKVMLVVGTKPEYFNAVWVKNEWSRYLKIIKADRRKLLIPCYRDMDAYELPEEFSHLQAQDMGKIGFIPDILRGIKKVIESFKQKPSVVNNVTNVSNVTNVTNTQRTTNISGGAAAASAASTAPLLERAFMFLEDGDFNSADTYAEKVLDIEPKNAEAYLVKLCSDLKLKRAEDLGAQSKPFTQNGNYQKALRFADNDLKQTLEGYVAEIEERERARLAEEARKAEEARRSKEERNRIKEEELKKGIPRLAAARNKIKPYANYISAYPVCVKSDNTVTLNNTTNYYNSSYILDCRNNIVAVAENDSCVLGLKPNGTVVTVGHKIFSPNSKRQYDVSGWRDIVAISAGGNHTVGLKSDGTVVDGWNEPFKQCEVSGWRDIVAISTSGSHTVGLKSDGTVVAVGVNYAEQCEVNGWRDIVAISAGIGFTVGLKSDGTVVAVGYNQKGQCEVSGWRDIVAVSAGCNHTIGLKSDGTVVAAGFNQYGKRNVSSWRDIVAIFAGYSHTVGLKSDGTVVVVGDDNGAVRNIPGLKLFYTAEEEIKRREEIKRAEEIKLKKENLNSEKSQLQEEYSHLTIFSGKRKKEIQARLAQIENEIKKLYQQS